MNTRIVIFVRGGIVTDVISTALSADFVIVDYDLQAQGICPVLTPQPQAHSFERGKAYLLIGGSPAEQEAADELKHLKF